MASEGDEKGWPRIAMSIQGVPIRLTEEWWRRHIIRRHRDLIGKQDLVRDTIENPDQVLVARATGEFLALRELEPQFWLSVVYRIESSVGFVITAHHVRRKSFFRRWKLVWP